MKKDTKDVKPLPKMTDKRREKIKKKEKKYNEKYFPTYAASQKSKDFGKSGNSGDGHTFESGMDIQEKRKLGPSAKKVTTKTTVYSKEKEIAKMAKK